MTRGQVKPLIGRISFDTLLSLLRHGNIPTTWWLGKMTTWSLPLLEVAKCSFWFQWNYTLPETKTSHLKIKLVLGRFISFWGPGILSILQVVASMSRLHCCPNCSGQFISMVLCLGITYWSSRLGHVFFSRHVSIVVDATQLNDLDVAHLRLGFIGKLRDFCWSIFFSWFCFQSILEVRVPYIDTFIIHIFISNSIFIQKIHQQISSKYIVISRPRTPPWQAEKILKGSEMSAGLLPNPFLVGACWFLRLNLCIEIREINDPGFMHDLCVWEQLVFFFGGLHPWNLLNINILNPKKRTWMLQMIFPFQV